MVAGKLRIRDWENTDRSGTTVEVEADVLGHDLTWGISHYTRNTTSSDVTTISEDDWGGLPDRDNDEDDELPLAAKTRKKGCRLTPVSAPTQNAPFRLGGVLCCAEESSKG